MLRLILWIAAGFVVCAALLFVPLPWPDAWLTGHIVNRIEVAAPPQRVFAYVATPANWPPGNFARSARRVDFPHAGGWPERHQLSVAGAG
jgi:hypothetical protein